MLRKGNATSWCWLGIEISWKRKAKRDGGNIRRGKEWGIITYLDFTQQKPLTRDEAIAEAEKPPELRQAIRDLADVRECSICRRVAFGEKYKYPTDKKWQIIHWGNIRLDLCPKCLEAISKGRINQPLEGKKEE